MIAGVSLCVGIKISMARFGVSMCELIYSAVSLQPANHPPQNRGIIEVGFMTIADAILIREAREWMASLAFLESPRAEELTLRFAIIARPGPNPLYLLLSHEELGAVDTKATLEEFPTLSEAVEAMKDTVRDLTPHAWRFVFNFYEC